MRKSGERDIHVLRYFSSFVSVSDGKVIHVTEPSLTYCPLAGHFYGDIGGLDKQAVRSAIRRVVESKIRDHGFFTPKRNLISKDAAVPCGASEMMMAALRKRAIDAVVVVCDGAGTIVTDSPKVVQGIGARMNSLLLTSPIRETMNRLKKLGCHIVFDHALIDQAQGVRKAIDAGYRRIAVTVTGHDSDKIEAIRQMDSDKIEVTILVVCTTGVAEDKIDKIRRHADLVWSCASKEVRQAMGAQAILQISKQIPVFVLTQRGIDLCAAVAQDGTPLAGLAKGRQYLVSHELRGHEVRFGLYRGFLREEKLPVLSKKNVVAAKVWLQGGMDGS